MFVFPNSFQKLEFIFKSCFKSYIIISVIEIFLFSNSFFTFVSVAFLIINIVWKFWLRYQLRFLTFISVCFINFNKCFYVTYISNVIYTFFMYILLSRLWGEIFRRNNVMAKFGKFYSNWNNITSFSAGYFNHTCQKCFCIYLCLNRIQRNMRIEVNGFVIFMYTENFNLIPERNNIPNPNGKSDLYLEMHVVKRNV